MPNRVVDCPSVRAPDLEVFVDLLKGTERAVSTTMMMVRLLSQLIKMPEIGKYIVPIVPDEARTFGMDGLFKVAGIYAPEGQNYQPVDADTRCLIERLLTVRYYKRGFARLARWHLSWQREVLMQFTACQ